MTEKEMIEIKHGSENMVDLLNQEQAELKKAMIEEMAKSYCDYCMAQTGEKKCENQADKRCRVFWDCEFFYNAGYRKILDGAVVLTKDEWEKYQITQRDWNAIYYDGIDKARKETAREILQSLSSVIHDNTRYGNNFVVVYTNDLDEIAKQFGVEVEE